jgi:DNA-binding XRE family transcriptional regulator
MTGAVKKHCALENPDDWSEKQNTMRDILTPGDRVRAARKIFGWSQRELANRAGVGRNLVAITEGGYRPSRATRDKLAAALDRDHDDLFAPVE